MQLNKIFVTVFKILDATFTERYLGIPNTSTIHQLYDDLDLSKYINKFKDKILLLIQGTHDERVLMSNHMLLAQSLANHGAIFRQQVRANVQSYVTSTKSSQSWGYIQAAGKS